MINQTAFLLTDFSFGEAFSVTLPLVLFVIGIVAYAVFIFRFYRFVARKEVFSLNLHQYSASFGGFLKTVFSSLIYVIKYIIFFPLLIFFWFGTLSLLLAFLAKDHDVSRILLLSMSLVASIRVTAYYNEDLSKDLAKMIPFALLGVFLVDMSYFSIDNSIRTIQQLPAMWKQLTYYLLFTIALEFVLRVLRGILTRREGPEDTQRF